MIKLTLLSGVTMDSRTDIFGRNLIHYCCTNNVNPEMMDIICHCIDFKNFSELCKYVDKCIPIDNNNIEEINTYSQEYQLQCEDNKCKDNYFETLPGKCVLCSQVLSSCQKCEYIINEEIPKFQPKRQRELVCTKCSSNNLFLYKGKCLT